MCGIAAFSVPLTSKLNARNLAHHLLSQIEKRGTHASGFAYIGADGSSGVYKNPKPGSQLSLAELPRDAKSVILHTRYATQGSVNDNRNNHPVMSTDNTIALVHNGVISNDHGLRPQLGIDQRHGEVDSLVIPSLIQQQGVSSLSKLGGYAAIAWLDTQEDGELHIARLKSSPVSYTHLIDGTFVMASTPELLGEAVEDAGLIGGGIFAMAETTMMSVIGGFIYEAGRSPSMTYDYGSYKRFSGATSGGHSSTTTQTPPKVQTPPKGSEDDASCELTIEKYKEDLDKWQEEQAKLDRSSQPMAYFGSSGWDDDVWSEYIEQLEARERDAWPEEPSDDDEMGAVGSIYGEGFYILDGEGDVSHHQVLEDLEARLRWHAKMSRSDYDLFGDVEDSINWVNHIMDIGHVDEAGRLISWVDDSGEVDEFESPAVRNLQYIREGVGLLATLKGA